MMSKPHAEDLADHNSRQRDYFGRSIKETMVPRRSRYLDRHVSAVLHRAGLAAGAEVLEVGCGMGRYTLLLAERGIAVEGLDLTPALLDRLREYNGGRYDIPLHAGDIVDAPPALQGRFEAVIGFFALHHMLDLDACYAAMARLVRPGGRILFLEPNPYNPSSSVQILFTPTTTWQGERGMLQMRGPRVFGAMRRAGLVEPRLERFGLFPPQLADHAWTRPAEAVGEALLSWTPCLAFQIFSARRPSR